jgi:hypothetical protein
MSLSVSGRVLVKVDIAEHAEQCLAWEGAKCYWMDGWESVKTHTCDLSDGARLLFERLRRPQSHPRESPLGLTYCSIAVSVAPHAAIALRLTPDYLTNSPTRPSEPAYRNRTNTQPSTIHV